VQLEHAQAAASRGAAVVAVVTAEGVYLEAEPGGERRPRAISREDPGLGGAPSLTPTPNPHQVQTPTR